LVFEIQVRAKLQTPHVSLGVLRECLVPWKVFENTSALDAVGSLVELALRAPSFEAEVILERYIAKAYGLDISQFRELLKAFPKLNSVEYDLLSSKDI
jgi:hypothetical protein